MPMPCHTDATATYSALLQCTDLHPGEAEEDVEDTHMDPHNGIITCVQPLSVCALRDIITAYGVMHAVV